MPPNKHFAVPVALVFLTLSSLQSAHANIGEAYGFGSRSASLAGATNSWGSEAYAAYGNPAALALRDAEPGKRLKLGYGWIYIQPTFTPITNVVTQNDFNSDTPAGTGTTGTVDTSYRPTFG